MTKRTEHRMHVSMMAGAALILLPAIAAFASGARGGLTIVDKGQPRAVIVVSSSPTDQAREAACVLRDYLERISGARLEILDDSAAANGTRILVGPSTATRRLGIDEMSQYSHAMNEERFVVKTIGPDLVLAGNEHPFYRGTAYAVYEFLERLGCRWFFPGDYGEVVPKQDTIVVENLNLDERPDFRFRNVWYSGWMPATAQDAADFAVWADRNKMNRLKDVSLPNDGTITRLAPPEQYFQTHANIYALDEKGEREKEMLCLTEPETVQTAVRTICETFRSNPNQSTFGFGPPDGYPMCRCERCQASNPRFSGKGYGEPSLSDVWFRFANAVAREVYQEFPDRWLLTNGYANRVRPPEGVGELSPNLGIQFAMIDTCTFHSIGDPKCWQRESYKTVFDRWTRDLRCVFIYDYDPGKALDGMPFPMLHNLMRDIPYFKKHGVWGFWTEGQNCWMVTHLNYYVRAKLMWNAERDVPALVRDYCERFYGGAADPIEEYMWTIENAVDKAAVHETFGRLVPWRVVLPPRTARELDQLMARAQRDAESEAAALHVRVFDQTDRYLKAHLAMENAAAEGDFAAAAGQAGEMLRIREEIGRVDPSLIPVTPEWCNKGDGALEWYQKTYWDLAARTNGPNGTLVAMTPAAWEFREDLGDKGVLEEWYAPNTPGPWKKLDTTLYWEAQGLQDAHGYGYAGKAWYRTAFPVPSDAAGKPITLTFGGVYSDKLWIWVNGFLVDHRFKQNTKNPFDVDVTAHIKPGEINRLAISLETLARDRNARGGLHRRVFLWSPKKQE